MRGSVRIAAIGDIEIGVHYSWLLVFLLVAWSLAVELFPADLPGLRDSTYWTMGFAASLLLFISVLVHELAHSVVAESLGLKVRGITLFLFGGVSNIGGEPTSARDELFVSVVGPLSSLALAGVFRGASQAAVPGEPVHSVLSYLVFVNVLLAAFNMIPGFPLDGGRVLRAAVWGLTRDFGTATRVGVWAGRLIGFLLALGGVFLAFNGVWFSGAWLALIGWFINNAAEGSARDMWRQGTFRNVTVGEVMTSRPVTVQADTSLSDVVHNLIIQRAVRSLHVEEDGTLVGMVTLNEIRSVPRSRWDWTPVRAVMTGLENLQTARPTDDLNSALGLLAGRDINQLPVVEDGRLVGLLSRANVIRFLQTRRERGLPLPEEDQGRAA